MNQLHCINFTTKLKTNALATGEASAKVKIYAIGVRLATRCCEIRFAPFAASARRLPPPDALVRYADFAHQAVLHNASASEAFGFKLRHCAKPPGR